MVAAVEGREGRKRETAPDAERPYHLYDYDMGQKTASVMSIVHNDLIISTPSSSTQNSFFPSSNNTLYV